MNNNKKIKCFNNNFITNSYQIKEFNYKNKIIEINIIIIIILEVKKENSKINTTINNKIFQTIRNNKQQILEIIKIDNNTTKSKKIEMDFFSINNKYFSNRKINNK